MGRQAQVVVRAQHDDFAALVAGHGTLVLVQRLEVGVEAGTGELAVRLPIVGALEEVAPAQLPLPGPVGEFFLPVAFFFDRFLLNGRCCFHTSFLYSP
jgi:hypothetical protein